MYPVKLNGSLLKALLRARFRGGVKEFLAQWDVRGELHRSTLHRWTKGALPQSRDDMLRLCALLDVDPFCLITPESADAAVTVNKLMYAFQNDHWKPAISFIREFMGRRTEWPPRQIATSVFGRPWTTVDFEHGADARKNYYAMVALDSKLQADVARPQTFHFAFRHPTLFGKRWLQYGFVIRHGPTVRLMHINGYTQDCKNLRPTAPTRVETFFGQGSVIFRVASLHPFCLRALEGDNIASPRVRFPA